MFQIMSDSEISPPSRSISPASVASIENFDNNDSWFIDNTPDYNYARNIQNNIYYNNYNNYNNYIDMLYNEVRYEIIPIQNVIHQEQSRAQIKFHIGVAFQPLEISEQQQECCVCMEKREKEEICELNCKHNFCGFCVKDILSKNNTSSPNCPLCREKIKNIKTQQKEIQNKLNEHCVLLI